MEQAKPEIRERSALPLRYRWNLADIFPSWEAWQEAYQDLERKVDDFASRKGTLNQGAAQLLAVPAALLTPVMVARWGDRRTILFGALGMALSTLPLALIPRWGAAGLGVMVEFGWSGSWIPAIQAYSQQMVSPAWRAAMSGAVLMAAGLGISAMAFGGGYVIAAWGYPSAFLLGGGLTAAGMLLFWLYTRVPRGEPASPQAR